MALTKKIYDSRTLIEQGQINKALAEKGLGQLHDEGLLDQLAMTVPNHQRFRKLLVRLPPDQRQSCYECLAPRLRFKALPLEDYVIEAKEAAAGLVRGNPAIVGDVVLDDVAPATLSVERAERIFERAANGPVSLNGIESAQRLTHRVLYLDDEPTAQTVARGRLSLVCTRCTREEMIYAMNKADAYETFAAMGWKIEGDKAKCPGCADPLKKNA